MRFVGLVCAVVLVVGIAAQFGPGIVTPPPASSRLAGVTVGVIGHSVEEIRDGRRLHVTVTVVSDRDVAECLEFALDQPFVARRLTPYPRGCVRPRPGRQSVSLVLDPLLDDDLAFPSHTVIWGVAGGRCGLILQLAGVCILDLAGSARLELPARTVLPSFAPVGSLFPLYSFAPIDFAP